MGKCVSTLAHSFLTESSSKLLVTKTGIKCRIYMSIYMFFEMKFDFGSLDSVKRLLPFGLLVH